MGLAGGVALLFLFLNARTAFWVAAGIPVAMRGHRVMYAAGLTLNMISLFALIITLGIVVDDAIVVGEHADHRAGIWASPCTGGRERARRRMALPVFSATVTTVIAFLALVVIGGRFGTLIADIPLTVIAVLLASLVECFLILPNHMATPSPASAARALVRLAVAAGESRFRLVARPRVPPADARVIAARYPVVAGLVALLASQTVQPVRGDRAVALLHAPERGSITGNFVMAGRQPGRHPRRCCANCSAPPTAVGAGRRAARHEPHHYVHGRARRAMPAVGWPPRKTRMPICSAGSRSTLIDADRALFVLRHRVAVAGRRRTPPAAGGLSFRSWGSGPGGDALSVRSGPGRPDTLKAAAEALNATLRLTPRSRRWKTSALRQARAGPELTPQGAGAGVHHRRAGHARCATG